MTDEDRNDPLGDRCKQYESAEAGRAAMRGLPLLARLDGRAFHTYTRGLQRPYDIRLSTLMIETTKRLVAQTHALVGYTQSDEITLCWYHPADSMSEYMFGGRFQKIASVLSGMASAFFATKASDILSDKASQYPHLDCRVWQVPTLREAADVFQWREDDATKNSVSMAAQAYYSHGDLHGKSSADKHEMLHDAGVNWNELPAFFKRGSYIQRSSVERSLTAEERERIPARVRPAEDATFERGVVDVITLTPLRRITNPLQVLFEGAAPIEIGTAS